VLVFVVGAFAEISDDVSRICDIIANDLAQTHVSYYNDDAKRTKGMYRQRIQKAWGTRRTAAGPASSSTAPGTSSPTARRTTAPTAQRYRRTRTIRTATSFSTTPRGGTTPLPRHAHANGAAIPTDEDDQDGHFCFNHPERGDYPAA